MDKDSVLNEIFNDDPLGLLNVKAKSCSTGTSDIRLQSSFHEINDFIDKNGRYPAPNLENISEYQLHSRLSGLRNSPNKHEYLRHIDKHGLLSDTTHVQEPVVPYEAPKEFSSIDDILGDDSGGILGDDNEGLFDLTHIPKQTTMPDYVARRKPCKDFDRFEHRFMACQQELSAGLRKLIPFKNEQQINEGCFYVLQGVLLLVEKVGKRKTVKGKVNARLRCIFENGTESDMMLRSLSAELYKDGRRITVSDDELLNGFNNISDSDEKAGYIYILRSLSANPKIQSIKNLYKIGYASNTVEDRIKNAENEPTYLMAKVHIVEAYQCYNMNPQKLEALVHRIFSKVCIDLDIADANGNKHRPREWFTAPLSVIEQAIEFIITGDITGLYYDEFREELRNR